MKKNNKYEKRYITLKTL